MAPLTRCLMNGEQLMALELAGEVELLKRKPAPVQICPPRIIRTDLE
jgi:hypothetical protein